jgi:hypothetical protein
MVPPPCIRESPAIAAAFAGFERLTTVMEEALSAGKMTTVRGSLSTADMYTIGAYAVKPSVSVAGRRAMGAAMFAAVVGLRESSLLGLGRRDVIEMSTSACRVKIRVLKGDLW